jgi:hypothetical protein
MGLGRSGVLAIYPENFHLEGTFTDNYICEKTGIVTRGNSFLTSYSTGWSPLGRHVKRVIFCVKCLKAAVRYEATASYTILIKKKSCFSDNNQHLYVGVFELTVI